MVVQTNKQTHKQKNKNKTKQNLPKSLPKKNEKKEEKMFLFQYVYISMLYSLSGKHSFFFA